jgi:hypothetical protein
MCKKRVELEGDWELNFKDFYPDDWKNFVVI